MRPSFLSTRAFGIAAGAVGAACAFVGTLLAVLGGDEVATPGLLRSVWFGYSVSPAGAFIGALWAYVYGFLAGAVFAFVYNLAATPELPPLE